MTSKYFKEIIMSIVYFLKVFTLILIDIKITFAFGYMQRNKKNHSK